MYIRVEQLTMVPADTCLSLYWYHGTVSPHAFPTYLYRLSRLPYLRFDSRETT